MMNPQTLLRSRNLKAKKQLGQNFLADPSTAAMIVERSRLNPEDSVLEIGAGMGSLTLPIADRVRRVFAVEKDRDLADLLKTQLLLEKRSQVQVIEGDILRIPLDDIFEQAVSPLIVMGNLPYNISSQVLIRLIHSRKRIERAILMFQKELADRLMADVGSRDYGRITVILRYCADIRPLARVNAHLFYPRPKVDSEVVEIVFKKQIDMPADDETMLVRVIRAAFGQRRKTLKNALSAGLPPIPASDTELILRQVGIDPVRRAETLSVPEFVALSNAITHH
ncbi:MAG: 16S rRNA (adenine(1518)-N(6)/adenine(1519)-N(6))-dimethyltransferase RsmA [Desulfatirhabdiaceae bacterium]